MARKGKATQSTMFGTTTRRILDVRPTSKKRGGGKKGDVAVVLSYHRQGKKRSRGTVKVLPVDDARRLVENG